MKTIQNADASRGLVRRFGLRGRSLFALDDLIVPTTDEGDFAGKSPWEPRVLAADAQTCAAVVGEHSGLVIIPGAGAIVVVEGVSVASAGAVEAWQLRIYRPADLAAVTIVSTSPAVQLNGAMLPSGLAPQASTTSSVIRHGDLLDGALFQQQLASANRSIEAMLPRGVVLDGTDPHGPIMLCVIGEGKNDDLVVSFVATEYREGR